MGHMQLYPGLSQLAQSRASLFYKESSAVRAGMAMSQEMRVLGLSVRIVGRRHQYCWVPGVLGSRAQQF